MRRSSSGRSSRSTLGGVEQGNPHDGHATLPFSTDGPWRPFITASLTGPLVDFATNVIGDLGTAGIFLLMLLDSACIPTSSEAIMLFAGFKVADGRFTLLEIVIAGVAGNLVGSWIAYGIGYYGRDRVAQASRQVAAHHPGPDRLGGPLVRALRRRDRLLLAHAARDPHVHLAAGRRRADALLAIHAC